MKDTLYRTGSKVPITGSLTDEKGDFKLNEVALGTYKLTVTCIPYPTKSVEPVSTTVSKPDNNVGNIIVSAVANTLKEAVVVGQQAKNDYEKGVFISNDIICKFGIIRLKVDCRSSSFKS